MKVSLLRKIWIILFLSVLGTSVHGQVMPERRKSPPQSQSLRSYNRFLDEHSSVERYSPLARKGGISLSLRQMRKAPGDLPTIYCNLLNDPSWIGNGCGIYTFVPEAGLTFTPVALNAAFKSKGGGWFMDGKYCYTHRVTDPSTYQHTVYLSVFDIESGSYEIENKVVDVNRLVSSCSAVYDPNNGLVYAACYNTTLTGVEFVSYDVDTDTRTVIAPLSGISVLNMSIDTSGKIYLITGAGDLYTINKETGVTQLVGNTGKTPMMVQGSVIDPATNTMYWAFFDGNASALYTVDLSTAAVSLIHTLPNDTEIGAMWIQNNTAADKAPSAVENLSMSYDMAALNDILLSFRMPTSTYDGLTPLAGGLTYTVKVNKTEVMTGTATPGENVSIRLQSQPTGKANIEVVAVNGEGESPVSRISCWVGPDNPKPVRNAVMKIDGSTATITWDAPEAGGEHGGMLSSDNVSYDVRRYPEGIVVSENQSATTFTETIDTEKLRNCYYGITAKSGDMESAETATNSETIGTYMVTPYSEDFSNDDNLVLYTVYDGNSDGKTWEWNNGFIRYNYSTSNVGNDWLFTPLVRLETGKTYTLSYKVKAYSEHYPEKLSVYYGNGKTVEAMTETLLPTTEIKNTEWETKQHELTVSATGTYSIAFHAESDAFMYYLDLTDIRIEDATMSVPNAVSDLTVTAAANGVHEATVEFKNPTHTLSGENIASLTKVEIYRGDELVKTFTEATDLVPGKQLAFVDDGTKANALYIYKVYAYNAYGKGEEAEASAYVGFDVPTNPRGIKMKDNSDGTVTLTWNVPTTGVNGGYVDTSGLVYTIYHMEVGLVSLEIAGIIAETTETTATVDAVLDGSPGYFFLGVGAKNNTGSSKTVGITDIIKGTSVGLPFAESFAGAKLGDTFWWAMNYSGTTYWEFSPKAVDGDGGSFEFTSKTDSDDALIGTQKITLKNTNKPTLMFSYYAVPGAKLRLAVEANKAQKNGDVELKSIDMSTLTGEEGWRSCAVDLSSLTSEEYVLIQFRATATEAGAKVNVDQVNIYDAPEYDLQIGMDIQKEALAGSDIDWTARITNMGVNDMAGYLVNAYVRYNYTDVDGSVKNIEELISSTEGSPVKLGDTEVYNFKYTTTPATGRNMTFTAEVVSANDNNTANNTVSSDVKIVQNEVPNVTDLAAGGTWDNVMLTWTAPDLSRAGKKPVTEDFEDKNVFEPFSIGGITETNHYGVLGDWTLYDEDGAKTYSWQGAEYLNMGTYMAYQVIPSNELFNLDDPSVVASVGAHSGTQYLASFDGVDSNGSVQTSDWLISPEMSGQAQTIFFYIKEITNAYGDETFEVLYSTTDNNPESFIPIDTYKATTVWTEMAISLPEGTKHFAIRNASFDCFGLLVDDITYYVEGDPFTMSITGYNIYVDGKLHAYVDAPVTQYNVTGLNKDAHRFNVTVIYDGTVESPLSNTPSFYTGIDTINADNAGDDVVIYNTSGAIVAKGRKALQSLPSGVYVVRQNGTSKKVNLE